MNRFLLKSIFIFLFLNVWAVNAQTQEDVLKFGMSTALSGPSSNVGLNMRHGVWLAMTQANQEGEVQGKKFKLIAYDDGYEPYRTVPNIEQLIEKENVLAFIGNVGTPTAIVAIPIIMQSKVPFYGAFTGGKALRKDPPDRYVINYRVSYKEETETIINALIDHFGVSPEQIAFFTERDAFGDDVFRSASEILKGRGLQDENNLIHGRFERNTMAVEDAVADILESKKPIKAVIMVGSYRPCAKFIQLAKQAGLKDVYFMNISFVGTESLIESLQGKEDNVFITQVVPPLSSDQPIVREYLELTQQHPAIQEPSLGSLEGFISTKIFIQAIRNISGDINRESIVNALEALGDFDIGLGMKLNLSRDNHQASHSVWLSKIEKGHAVLYVWEGSKK